SNQKSWSSSPALRAGVSMGAANASEAQYTPVDVSNSPRVVGESKMGGRTARKRRSPASNDSPSLTQRHRVGGTPRLPPSRSTMNQLRTSVAFGHASISAFRFAGVVDVVVADE